MATVRDFLKNTLQLAGVTGIQQNTPSEYLEMALYELNAEVDSLNTRNFWPAYQKEEIVTLPTPYTKQISIGPTGDIVSDRPLDITVIKYKQGDYYYPVQKVQNSNYNWIVEEESTSGIPAFFRYLQEVPNGIIEFNVIPSSITEIKIVSNSTVGEYELNDEFINVQGALQHLRYTIAQNLCTSIGDPSMESMLTGKADKYQRRYETSHVNIGELPSDHTESTRSYDFRSDVSR